MSAVPLPPDYNDDSLEPRQPRRSRKRIIAWTTAGALVALVVMWILVVGLLQKHSVRLYLLRIASPKISALLGADVRISDFRLHPSWLSPSVELYNVVVDGASPYQTPPLLQVDRLEVGVQIVSIVRRRWYLSQIVVDHPTVHVVVDKDGNTNLPKVMGSGQSTNIVDLGVRRAILRQGDVYYNDRKSVLDVSLHDVEFQSRFDPSQKKYSGSVSYRNGQVHLNDMNPMAHSFEAEFEATAGTFTLKRSKLTSGASEVSLTATLNDYVHPNVKGVYQASLDSGELRQILEDANLPLGVVKLAGSGAFQSRPDWPLLRTLSLDGNLISSALQIHTTTIDMQVRNVSAQYDLRGGDVDVRNLRAEIFGGNLEGSYTMRDLVAARQSELNATLKNIALAEIQTLANPTKQQFRLGGTGNATLDVKWHKAFDALTAHADANLRGIIAPAKGNGDIPVDGDFHAGYSAAGEVRFTQSHLRMPQTVLQLNGTVSEHTSLQILFQSADLHEVEAVAQVFGLAPEPLGLFGTASFRGTVRGSKTTRQITGQLSAPSLKIKGTDWRMLETALDASPSHLELQANVRTKDTVGRLTFNAKVVLDHWSFKDTNPLQLDLHATQFHLEDLTSLAGLRAPASGTLTGNVSLRGSQLSPVGEGSVRLTQGVVDGEPIPSASMSFQANGDEVVAHILAQMAAGNAQGDITYFPKRKAYDGQVQATGIHLDQFRMLRARNIVVMGTLNANVRGAGTLDNPSLDLTAEIPSLQVRNQTYGSFTFRANVANLMANVLVDAQATNSFVRGRAKVNLTSDYFADATIDTSALSLQPLFDMYLPGQATNLNGQAELHAVLKGPLKNPLAIDAQLTLPTLSLAYGSKTRIAAVQPIQFEYRKGMLTLQKTAIRGTGTDLQLQGTFPVRGTDPIAMTAVGTIDLAIAEVFNSSVTSSGQVRFNINGYGQRTNPGVRGQINVVGANFTGDNLLLGLNNGNGVLNLTGHQIEIDQFQGNVGNGTLIARGNITYWPSVQFTLVLAANDIRLLYPPGVLGGINTDLTMTGSMQSAALRGQVQLNELTFTPTFDLAEVLSGFARVRTVPPQGFARHLDLDVTVHSADDLSVASSKLNVQGSTNLRLRGTAAEPAVLGRVNLTGGELFFRGNRYSLQPGTLDFVNPYSVEPRVNLSVETKVQQYAVKLSFRGPIDQLRATYSSEPSLPPADIINLLAFGKTTEPANMLPGLDNLGAESILASGVSDILTNRVERAAGISQLSIDPVLGGDQQESGARVTIQQRVTANLFVTFAADTTSTGRQVVTIEYQATPRLSVSGVSNQNGGFALDVRVRKTW